ncbi:Hypothetical predicted protein [Paramuricea clavata]|uniref:Uncharacterized protein n=1 Tax=Paramuricea clavata TaxID=317549 RepID=A0A6S7J2G8_PARCT|nr:Hypothetical predicted protein [Paramuricea clavata]
MENIFLKWKHSSVDAVSFFVQLYARPVKNSWKRISWWFLAHNIVTFAIPLYDYELAQAVSGSAYHSKHLPQFTCYLIFIVTIWLAPTVVGELIKRRERKFMERINDISPWLLEAESHSLGEVHSVRSGTHSHGEQEIDSLGEEDSFGDTENDSVPLLASNNDDLNLTLNPRQTASQYSIGSTSAEGSDIAPTLSEYTFASRGEELRNFLRFLKRRTPGLVSRGYSLQLNLSLISLIGGAISFLIKLNSMNSDDIVYRNCNCTMSYA